jgi:hypothetical protein
VALSLSCKPLVLSRKVSDMARFRARTESPKNGNKWQRFAPKWQKTATILAPVFGGFRAVLRAFSTRPSEGQ